MPDPTFDQAVITAWDQFSVDLTRRPRMLGLGQDFDIEQIVEFPDGPQGRVGFSVTRDGLRRAVIEVDDLHTTPDCREEQSEWLAEAGWHRVDEETIVIETDVGTVEQLAQQAVSALRGVWDVLHPAFLLDAFDEATFEPALNTDAPSEAAAAVIPTGPQHLQQLVIEVLFDIVGEPIRIRSQTNTIELPASSGIESSLGISGRGAQIELFAKLAEHIDDPDTVGRILQTFSARWPNVALVLRDTDLYAIRTIEAAVFHPLNLAKGILDWRDFLADAAPGIVAELNPTTTHRKPEPHVCEFDSLPTGLADIIERDKATPLTPSAVAAICDYDVSTLERYLAVSEGEWQEWRENRRQVRELADADPDDVALCQGEVAFWRRLTAVLRTAARIARQSGSTDNERPISK